MQHEWLFSIQGLGSSYRIGHSKLPSYVEALHESMRVSQYSVSDNHLVSCLVLDSSGYFVMALNKTFVNKTNNIAIYRLHEPLLLQIMHLLLACFGLKLSYHKLLEPVLRDFFT